MSGKPFSNDFKITDNTRSLEEKMQAITTQSKKLSN